uniref:(northern house mosquito) hypothetical protein n=1 Tax=Culex pipiens TaxID=7175 RepID=A0A8D8NY58_CULPI
MSASVLTPRSRATISITDICKQKFQILYPSPNFSTSRFFRSASTCCRSLPAFLLAMSSMGSPTTRRHSVCCGVSCYGKDSTRTLADPICTGCPCSARGTIPRGRSGRRRVGASEIYESSVWTSVNWRTG